MPKGIARPINACQVSLGASHVVVTDRQPQVPVGGRCARGHGGGRNICGLPMQRRERPAESTSGSAPRACENRHRSRRRWCFFGFLVGVSLGARERFSDCVGCAMPYRKTRLTGPRGVQQGARAARGRGYLCSAMSRTSGALRCSSTPSGTPLLHAPPSSHPHPPYPAHRFCQAHCLRDSIPSGRAGPLR